MEKPQNEKEMIDFLETLNIVYKKIADSWGFGKNEVKHCNYLFAQCFNLLENMAQNTAIAEANAAWDKTNKEGQHAQ